MQPLTEKQPKILLPVYGAKFLDYQLSWLYGQGVTRVVFCLGHFSHLIVAHLRSSPWRRVMDFRVSDEGERALGTAGAVRLAIEGGLIEESFLTLYGDTLPAMDLSSAINTWQASGLHGMLTVYPVRDSVTVPTASIKEGNITDFVRNLPAFDQRLTHADYGVSGFHRRSFQSLPVDTRFGFAKIHQQLARAGQLAAVELDQPPNEIGSHTGYMALMDALTGPPSPPPSV